MIHSHDVAQTIFFHERMHSGLFKVSFLFISYVQAQDIFIFYFVYF